MKYYAGIGARVTPQEVCDEMTQIATELEKRAFVLRSGGAIGADTAFEKGVEDSRNSQIFHSLDEYEMRKIYPKWDEAKQIAKNYHPQWSRLGAAGVVHMTRNVFQVLGSDLSSFSSFLITWTKDGKASGGTGQAIRIAQHPDYNIPVLNLKNPAERAQVINALGLNALNLP